MISVDLYVQYIQYIYIYIMISTNNTTKPVRRVACVQHVIIMLLSQRVLQTRLDNVAGPRKK